MVNSASLARAPLVIKQRKTTRISLDPLKKGGVRQGQRDTLVLDMANQGLEDIQFILKAITAEEIIKEEKKGNPLTRLVVDNREGKTLGMAERKTEAFFGNFLDKKMIDLVQRSLMQAIRSAGLAGATKQISSVADIDSISDWQWYFIEKPRADGVPINVNKLGNLPQNSALVLMPKSVNAGLKNMVAAWIDAGWKDRDLYYSEKPRKINQSAPITHRRGRSRGKGFMAKAVGNIKRSRLMKNYTMSVVFSNASNSLVGERYGRGTPVIVIRARRLKGRTGASRNYKRFT